MPQFAEASRITAAWPNFLVSETDNENAPFVTVSKLHSENFPEKEFSFFTVNPKTASTVAAPGARASFYLPREISLSFF